MRTPPATLVTRARRPILRRGLALLFAALLSVSAWAPPVNHVVVPLTGGLVPAIESAAAVGTPCSNYADSIPLMTGWLSDSGGTKLTITTTGSVYGRIGNNDQSWDLTHCYAYRYDAILWTPTGSTSNLTVDWGALSGDGLACRYFVGTTDFFHANSGACPGLETTARHIFTLNPEGTYQNDTAFNNPGDFAFAHSDCYTFYGVYGGSHPVTGATTSSTSGKPGANCGNKAIEATDSAQSLLFDATPPSPPSTPDLATASDTGTSSTDNITKDTTPTFTGTAEANATVTLYDGATARGTATATGGSWSITSSALSAATHSITATATDSAGNVSTASGALSVTVDTANPPPPSTPDLAAASDTGTSSTDNITSDTTPTFTGSSESGAGVALFNGKNQIGSGTAVGTAWSVTVSPSLAAGTYNVTAKATDAAGNQGSASGGLSVTIDTAVPAAPSTPDLDPGSDTGAANTDNITADTTPTFSGSAEDGSSVTLYDGAASRGTATATGGSWTITASTLAAGMRSMTAKATDAAGHTSTASGALSVTIDTTAPTLSAGGRSASPTGSVSLSFTITGSENLDCGSITAADFTLTAATFTSSTGAAAVCTVVLTSTVAAGTTGTSAVAAGSLSVADVAGNATTTASGLPLSWTVDRTPPAVTTIDLQPGSDTGASSTDNLTKATSLVYDLTFAESVTGVAAGDLSVTGTATGCVVGAPGGSAATYTVTLSGCSAGTVILTFGGNGALDGVGNTGPTAPATAATVTVDRTAPTASIDLDPGSDSGSSASDHLTNAAALVFSLGFSESVTGLAAGDLAVTGTATGCVVGTPAGAGAAYTVTLTSCSGGTVILTLGANAVSDSAGNTGPTAAASAPTVTIDRTAPIVPWFTGPASPTNATSLPFSLTLSESVTGLAAGDFTITGSATGWSVNSITGSGAGPYTITLTGGGAGTVILTLAANAVSDPAGNTGPASSSAAPTITVDRTAPSVSSFTGPATPTNATSLAFSLSLSESVTGLAAGDFTITGSATAWTVGSITGSGAGPYTISLTGGGAGTVILTLGANAASDPAGNTGPSSPSAAPTITVDRTAPDAPSIPNLDPGSDTGPFNTDNITAVTTPTFTGIAEPGATVVLFSDGTQVGSAVASVSDGTWSITSTSTLSSGVRSITVRAIDPAGNMGDLSGALLVTIDVTSPGATIAIDAGAAYATSTSASLNVTASDAGSGVASTEASNDGVAFTTVSGTAPAWTLIGSDGTRSVWYRVTDTAGNVTTVSDDIALDTIDPNATISINAGASTTVTTLVTLTVSYSDASGIVATQASNDGVTFTAVSGTSPAWTLTGGDGTKTVWYRVTDNAGLTTTVSDTITLFNDWAPGPGASEAVPYQASGWSYQQVTPGGGAGFEAPGFDDSGWATGTGAFASGGSCAVQTNGSTHTSWAVDTDMLVRRHISLAPGTRGVQVWVAIDNDITGIYWNGVLIGGPSTHEGCPALNDRAFAIDPALVGADNVLAIRARDRGVQAYFDAHVITGGMPIEPALDGTISQENGATGGDPVATFSGAFLYSFTDLAIAGRGPSPVVTRSYNSADTRLGPLGPGWTDSYYARLRAPDDGSGDLLFVRPDGNTDRFTRTSTETFNPSPATYARLVRNADLSYTVTEPDQLRWSFDASGKLTTITDRYGGFSALSYDANGRLVSVADPAGRGALTLAYTDNRLTSVTDWLSPARTVTYGYDSLGRLETVTDREGHTTTYAYDGTSSRLASITDARGHVAITLTYDAQGRVATQKDAAGLLSGETTTFAYVVNGDGTRVTTTTLPHTSFQPAFSPILEDHYTAAGWITQRTSHPSSTETLTETYTYDATGNRTSVTDARGNRTDFCYDVNYGGVTIAGSRGNLTRIIEPAATSGGVRPVTLLKYDAKNNLIQRTPPNGVGSGTTVTCATNLGGPTPSLVTDLAYDATGVQLLSTTSQQFNGWSSLAVVTRYEYGDSANPGRVTRAIPPRGNTGATPDYSYATTYTYGTTGSSWGMLLSMTDPLGDTTTYTYDAVGRLTASVDPLGNASGGLPADHRTEFSYDGEDRVRFVTAPAPTASGDPLISETRYDAVGNPVVRIDAAGQVTTYTYDERDALSAVKESPAAWTDPASPPSGVITTAYAYDASGNLARMTRAAGDSSNERVTEYAYDGRNQVRTETQYPAWPSTSGTLVTTTTYDANGNVATLLDPLGQSTSYAYDAANRLTSIDYSSSGTPDVSYTYDRDGNRLTMTDGTGLTEYESDEAGRPTEVTMPGWVRLYYAYDLDGHRTQLIYPDLLVVDYTYDHAGQLSGLTDWASRSVAYTYHPDGTLATTTNPDGTVTTYAYDNDHRSTAITDTLGTTTLADHAYTLDPLGNVTGLTEGSDTFTYGYDALSRLTDVTGPDGTRSYAYDPVGNRTSKVLGTTTTSTFDRADRQTAAGSTSVTLDANGNTTARGTDTFTYDQANRLVSATVGTTTETSTYTGDGVRATRQVDAGPVTTYVTDIATSLPVTLSDGTRTYVYGLGLAYAVAGTTLEVYHTDRLGSVRLITDASGSVTATYRTDEWGIPTVTTGSSDQPYGFTGEPVDATGLSYLRARSYDPGTGRFMTRDVYPGVPSRPESCNRYAYVGNNPNSLRDPTGHKPSGSGCLPMVIAGAAALVVMGILDTVFGGVSVAVAPSVVGELAMLPIDIGAFYLTAVLWNLTQKAFSHPCDDLRYQHLENPF